MTDLPLSTSVLPRASRPHGVWGVASRLLDGYTALGGYAIDPDKIFALVAAREGSDDLGPDAAYFREALAVYCDSVNRDARPHGIGRFYVHRRVCQVAVRARLRVANDLRASARPKRAPLLVCGLPRSGTTFLHRLLALADGAAAIPYWQLVEPLPPLRGPDRRLALAERNVRVLAQMVPTSLDAQHLVRADLADECGYLLRTSFAGAMPWQLPVYSWLQWSLTRDTLPAYRAWAAYLSRLEPEGRRLVLKDPFHAANLREIHAVCPDAMIVQTHRDPVEVVPSFHKLCATVHTALVPRHDLPRAVAVQTEWLAWLVDRNAEARAHFPPQNLVDVDYRALVRDPLDTVAHIHDAFGLPLTDAHVARMRVYMQENAQRKHGDNPYSAEQFDQHAEEIAERFAQYSARFGLASREIAA